MIAAFSFAALARTVLPWLFVGLALTSAVALIRFDAFSDGRAEAERAYLAEQLDAERVHAERLAVLLEDLEDLEATAASLAAKTDQGQRALREEINRYAQRTPAAAPCLDADGLRLWRQSNAAGHPDTEAAGLAAANLPAAAAAGRQRAGLAAPQSRGGGDALPAVSRPAPGAERLRGARERSEP